MSDRNRLDTLRDVLTALVGMGGAAALAAAAAIGDGDVGLGILVGVLGLILAAMVLVAIELCVALRGLISSIAVAAQVARARRDARRLQRQRLVNSLAVEFGYASARGISVRQAWDEALERCLGGPGQIQADAPA